MSAGAGVGSVGAACLCAVRGGGRGSWLTETGGEQAWQHPCSTQKQQVQQAEQMTPHVPSPLLLGLRLRLPRLLPLLLLLQL